MLKKILSAQSKTEKAETQKQVANMGLSKETQKKRIMEDESTKKYVCRSCGIFLDTAELEDGKCPECKEDDYIFQNDLLEEN